MSFPEEDEGEKVITLKEAVEQEKTREEDAIAVFGAADENNCTYPLGYMERQAIFSCLTCDPLQHAPAGVCYACAVRCHKDHELVELYTKRNFRCDCGNSKFDDFKCSLLPEKDSINPDNSYNHNFIGKYCTCDKPYPDPDDEIEDEMIQCVVCEDWYHSRHLGCLSPADYAEMICDTCVKKCSFLQYYKDHEVPPCYIPTKITNAETADDVDITGDDKNGVVTSPSKTMATDIDTTSEHTSCILERLKKKHKEVEKGKLVVMFLENGWRSNLCQCQLCLELYRSCGVSFLCNLKDTIECYEEKGKQNVEKVIEEAASTISNLNRFQQVELLQGYHDLKSGMHDFFNTFPEDHVFSPQDISDFFENLNKKRRRLNNGQAASSC